jgi:hypothetical protein
MSRRLGAYVLVAGLLFVVGFVVGIFAPGLVPWITEGSNADTRDNSRWIIGAIAFVVGALLAAMGTRAWVTARTAGTPDTSVDFFIWVAAAVLVGLGSLLLSSRFPETPEIQTALVIVIAIAALLMLLFVVASGFSRLQLSDAKQPLGLPEGSIRALIALFLILIFIIFGIYLFRVVGEGSLSGPTEAGPIEMTGPETLARADDIARVVRLDNGNYDVWLARSARLRPISEEGMRLSQQLITTVGTLVVAVAGFYFGSTAVSSAAAAVRGDQAGAEPIITTVTPSTGATGASVDLEIQGRDFRMPRALRLVRGDQQIPATDILASPTRITGTVVLDQPAGGENWDVVVEYEDGTEVRLVKAFAITA